MIKYFLNKIDHLVIKYLTVERGRNKRKWIWKTQNFREISQLHFPRLLFTGFVVVMCWKIHNKVKDQKNDYPYKAKSIREEQIEKQEKVGC